MPVGDALKRVTSGQRIRRLPAEAWNAFIDAANYVRAQSGGHGFDGTPEPWKPCTIIIKNDSGSDIDRFGILAINGPIVTPTEEIDEFQRHVVLSGVAPTADGAKFAILLEAIPSGDMGRALLSGVALAKLYVPSGTSGLSFADSTSGVTEYLTVGAAGGAEILWKESGISSSTSDLKWAVVRLPGVLPLVERVKIGKVYSSDIGARSSTTVSSGTVSVYRIVSGTLTDTGTTETVYNLTDSEIQVGTWVVIVKETNTDQWVIAHDAPATRVGKVYEAAMTPRDGTTLGSGKVKLQDCSSGVAAEERTLDKVYNIATHHIPYDTWVVCGKITGADNDDWVVIDYARPEFCWQATVSTSASVDRTDPTAANAVVPFDTVDVSAGDIWGALAAGALPINAAGKFRFHVLVRIDGQYPGGPTSNPQTIAAWLQKKVGAGAWADIANSADRCEVYPSISTNSRPRTLVLNPIIPVSKGDQFRVLCIATSDSFPPFAFYILGNDSTFTGGGSHPASTTIWNIEAVEPDRIDTH